jgi:hypothetical protein
MKGFFRRVLSLVFLAAACATSSSTTSGRTMTVGPSDSGSTITLRTGDHLVVQLGGSSEAIQRDWRLVEYPQSALSETRALVDQGRFEFEAVGPGQGQLVLAGQAQCDRGQGNAYGGYGPGCPVAGAGTPIGVPVLRFAVTIQVS